MEKRNFHKDFRLNGISFTSDKEMLDFTEKKIPFITNFLNDWFDKKEFIIVQTSGSTGKPKPIKILKNQMKNSALATADFLELHKKTTALLCLSTDYIAGKMMLVRALVLGWYLDVIEAQSTVLQENKKYDFVAMAPVQVQNSLTNLYKVKKLLIGGGAISKKLENRLQNEKTAIFSSYGMTETITHIAIRKVNFIHTEKDVCYKTLPNVFIRLDERGCLVIDAKKVATDLIITNDLVTIMDASHFVWLGRIDNIINSGGIKIIPEQIEKKLTTIITTNFFIGSKKDDILGEKLILLIEGNFDKKILNKIKESSLLSKYEKPKEIIFLDKFIYTKTGKINRFKSLNLI